jgi:2'-5' RNA ligase
LRFLGNVSAQQVNELIEIIQAIGRGFSPLHLSAARMGFFPNSRSPRVLWVGVQERDGQLLPLQKALLLATQPFTQERAETDFTGHVTLARFNRLPRMQAEKLARAVSASETRVFGDWSSNQFEVIRSELSSQGARHTTLATLPLGGAESNQRLS